MFLNPKKILAHAHIAPGMSIADFESGAGFFALEAARLLKNDGKVFCIGSNPDLLRRISNEAKHRNLEGIEILTGHIERKHGVPLKDGSLDLVIMANIFFGVDQKDKTVQEAFRLLHKGGRVFFVEWIDSFGGLGPEKSKVVAKEDAIAAFKVCGFEIIKEVDADSFHFAYVFRKMND